MGTPKQAVVAPRHLEDAVALRLPTQLDSARLLQEAHAHVDAIGERWLNPDDPPSVDEKRSDLRRLEALDLLLRNGGYDRTELIEHCRAVLPLDDDGRSEFRRLRRWLGEPTHRLEALVPHKELLAIKEVAADIAAGLASKKAPRPRAALSRREHVKMSREFRAIRYAGNDELFLERAFAEDMLRSWNEPLLTTTAHAVETLHMLARREHRIAQEWVGQRPDNTAPDFFVSEDLLRFVEHRFDEGEQLYRDSAGRQVLYATSSALAVFKAALDRSRSELPSAAQLQKLFPGLDARACMSRCEQIRRATSARLDAMLSGSVEDETHNAIVEINHALRILWNLSQQAPDEYAAECERRVPALTKYLSNCHVRAKFSRGRRGPAETLDAFVMSPDSRAPCLTACVAALRIADHARLRDPELTHRLLACGAYIAACRTPESGFGSSVGHNADLVHTYMALSARAVAQQLPHNDATSRALASWNFVGEAEKYELLQFIDRCHKDDGGYALVPEWRASAYGTRLAFQSLTRLGLPIIHAGAMKRFFKLLLQRGDVNECGYSGLPSGN